MAELLPTERLQPSLLDRLTDDDPDKRQESREQRVLSVNRLRQSVLRDMAWLLNSVCLESVQSLENHPEVRDSVLNYGIPDMSGHHISLNDMPYLERRIREAILAFEPRILPATLKVTVATSEEFNHNALSFDILGDLWMQPLPLRLYLKTQVELETGNLEIRETVG